MYCILRITFLCRLLLWLIVSKLGRIVDCFPLLEACTFWYRESCYTRRKHAGQFQGRGVWALCLECKVSSTIPSYLSPSGACQVQRPICLEVSWTLWPTTQKKACHGSILCIWKEDWAVAHSTDCVFRHNLYFVAAVPDNWFYILYDASALKILLKY